MFPVRRRLQPWRSTCVAPGIAAQIQPEDITNTLLHLVSDGAKLITGQTIVVDGGKYFLG
jgi:enoyl-[acyl-carrier-protein] reductase (NADH)